MNPFYFLSARRKSKHLISRIRKRININSVAVLEPFPCPTGASAGGGVLYPLLKCLRDVKLLSYPIVRITFPFPVGTTAAVSAHYQSLKSSRQVSEAFGSSTQEQGGHFSLGLMSDKCFMNLHNNLNQLTYRPSFCCPDSTAGLNIQISEYCEVANANVKSLASGNGSQPEQRTASTNIYWEEGQKVYI